MVLLTLIIKHLHFKKKNTITTKLYLYDFKLNTNIAYIKVVI